jgi:hypothetical protein
MSGRVLTLTRAALRPPQGAPAPLGGTICARTIVGRPGQPKDLVRAGRW